MSKKAVSMKYQATPTQGRPRKEQLVAKYTDKVGRAKAMVFANYQGLTHLQLERLKREVKKLDGEFVATKNTLMLRALKDQNVELSDEAKNAFRQPTATLFTYADPVEPLKSLAKMIKEFKLPVIKFGIFDGKTLSDKDVEKLATLPSLAVLRGQLVSTLNSPIQSLHRALNWNLVRLAMTLKAIETKKTT